MNAKKTVIATTINAALAFVVMMTTATTAQTIEITNAQPEEPLVVRILSDAHAGKWFKFRHLAKAWAAQRSIQSSVTAMSMMPAYQSIVGMGEDAVPLIVAQLKSEGDDPDQWFWALKAITQVDPVKPEDRGDFVAMAQSWIKWAEDEGYAG